MKYAVCETNHACMCMYIFMLICVSYIMCNNVDVWVCIYVRIYMGVYACVCMYLCMDVCMGMYIIYIICM